jgi:hypothetical protein
VKEKLKIWIIKLLNPMAKIKKETTEKKDDLLTLKTKPKPVETTPEGSVFSGIVQPGLERSISVAKNGERSIITNPAALPPATVTDDGIETADIHPGQIVVDDTPVPEAPPKTVVYEVTYVEEGEEQLVYTKEIPTFLDKYQLEVTNAFGRIPLKEIILGRKKIETSCFNPLEETEFTIDLRGGLLLKVIPEQEWMNRSYSETKKSFDEAVLKAYRDLAAQGITSAPVPTPIPQQPAQKGKRPPQQQAQQPADDYYPEGNIPVQGRGSIKLKDF